MRGDAGGNRVNTAMGYGLLAGLFVFGWVVLGTMLLLNEIFGGADLEPAPESPPEPAPSAGAA